MTTRLRSKRLGFRCAHFAYTLRACSQPTTPLAMSGKKPSSTKLPSRPRLKMSPTLLMLASCVPAFTYTTVPASMPSWLTQ